MVEHPGRLLERVASRDEAALSELYDQTGGRVFGMALHVLQDRAMAEDVTLDFYASIWDGSVTLPSGAGNPLVGMLTMARRRAIEVSLSRNLDSSESAVEVDGQFGAAPPEATQHDRVTREDGMCRALDHLDGNEKSVVTLAFFRGYSVSRIARRLNLPDRTVQALLHRGFAQLRDHVQESEVRS